MLLVQWVARLFGMSDVDDVRNGEQHAGFGGQRFVLAHITTR